MKQVGSAVSNLAYGNRLYPEAAIALSEIKHRAHNSLVAIGIHDPANLLERAENQLLATVGLCESPIEQTMLVALGFMVIPGVECFPPAIHNIMGGEGWPISGVVIAPQFVIARYRLDFLIRISAPRRAIMVAVECDGAAFHEPHRDIKRDQYLEAIGVKTIRYTGKWIYKNNFKVADEIAAIVKEEMAA